VWKFAHTGNWPGDRIARKIIVWRLVNMRAPASHVTPTVRQSIARAWDFERINRRYARHLKIPGE
jgi:hypothetical protein